MMQKRLKVNCDPVPNKINFNEEVGGRIGKGQIKGYLDKTDAFKLVGHDEINSNILSN